MVPIEKGFPDGGEWSLLLADGQGKRRLWKGNSGCSVSAPAWVRWKACMWTSEVSVTVYTSTVQCLTCGALSLSGFLFTFHVLWSLAPAFFHSLGRSHTRILGVCPLWDGFLISPHLGEKINSPWRLNFRPWNCFSDAQIGESSAGDEEAQKTDKPNSSAVNLSPLSSPFD